MSAVDEDELGTCQRGGGLGPALADDRVAEGLLVDVWRGRVHGRTNERERAQTAKGQKPDSPSVEVAADR